MIPETSVPSPTIALAPPPAEVATLGSLLTARDRQIAAFDDRYGRDAHARLLERLDRPCVSFADIAAEFGVSRERVRQWRLQWAPQAPTGLERRRQCLATRRRRQLLAHPSFRSFYQEVRRQVPAHRRVAAGGRHHPDRAAEVGDVDALAATHGAVRSSK